VHASALCPVVEDIFELRTFLLETFDSLLPDLLPPALFRVPVRKPLDELGRFSAVALSATSYEVLEGVRSAPRHRDQVIHFQLDVGGSPAAVLAGMPIALEDLEAESIGDFANLFFQADHLDRQYRVGKNASVRTVQQ
jgi:hypothetical protein